MRWRDPQRACALSLEHSASPTVDGSQSKHNKLVANNNGLAIFVSAERFIHYRSHGCIDNEQHVV